MLNWSGLSCCCSEKTCSCNGWMDKSINTSWGRGDERVRAQVRRTSAGSGRAAHVHSSVSGLNHPEHKTLPYGFSVCSYETLKAVKNKLRLFFSFILSLFCVLLFFSEPISVKFRDSSSICAPKNTILSLTAAEFWFGIFSKQDQSQRVHRHVSVNTCVLLAQTSVSATPDTGDQSVVDIQRAEVVQEGKQGHKHRLSLSQDFRLLPSCTSSRQSQHHLSQWVSWCMILFLSFGTFAWLIGFWLRSSLLCDSALGSPDLLLILFQWNIETTE